MADIVTFDGKRQSDEEHSNNAPHGELVCQVCGSHGFRLVFNAKIEGMGARCFNCLGWAPVDWQMHDDVDLTIR